MILWVSVVELLDVPHPRNDELGIENIVRVLEAWVGDTFTGKNLPIRECARAELLPLSKAYPDIELASSGVLDMTNLADIGPELFCCGTAFSLDRHPHLWMNVLRLVLFLFAFSFWENWQVSVKADHMAICTHVLPVPVPWRFSTPLLPLQSLCLADYMIMSNVHFGA